MDTPLPTSASARDVTVSITMPCDLRVRLDAIRVAIAQRRGGLSPKLREVVIEALTAFIERETAL